MKELAQIRSDNGKLTSTDADHQYEGIAKIPMARRWIRKCLKAEMRKALKTEGSEQLATMKRVDELRAQLRPVAKETRG